ncbi:MAG: hypothetical protein GC204_03785 [Chloroflexi bacterium]|nr:hypothetical protein [Chloroflexota bacterium]
MTKDPQPNRLIVENDEDTIAPERDAPPPMPAVKPSPTRRPKTNLGRGPYPGRRQITAHVDTKLFRWLKTISAATDTPMVSLMEQALQAFVEKYAAQKGFGQR